MKKTIKRSMLLAGAAMLAMPAAAMAAGGITGHCADCHTMHNSEQGAVVAKVGLAGTFTGTPNQNLLKFDCIACHAQGATTNEKIVTLTGLSQVPQVYHTDPSGDLAGGNFAYISGTKTSLQEDSPFGDRKGHNVIDLLPVDADNVWAPGDIRTKHAMASRLTCAGVQGCHGTRAQNLYGTGTTANYTLGTAAPRDGIAAISGAHHANYDGAKEPVQIEKGVNSEHDGSHVAASYRFLRGLKGYGNTTDRWQNLSATSHNEYFGVAGGTGDYVNGDPTISGCNTCHVTGSTGARHEADSTLRIPNQSMSGLCSTCHGVFHSSGTANDIVAYNGYGPAAFCTDENGNEVAPELDYSNCHGTGENNGVSGAFLRHPSDFILPDADYKEYLAYTAYELTAPVARDTVRTAASSLVEAGKDMVMCLSCHQAHATPYDAMLRFDYNVMVAGGGELGQGCLACHTTKGKIKN
jgi:hypothetical protein